MTPVANLVPVRLATGQLGSPAAALCSCPEFGVSVSACPSHATGREKRRVMATAVLRGGEQSARQSERVGEVEGAGRWLAPAQGSEA